MKFIRRWLGIREESLESLFFKRAEKFSADSAVIFRRIPVVLAAIGEFLGYKAPTTSNATLIWTDISLAGVGTDNPIIIVIGTLEYPPGAEAELKNGDRVMVTPDTREYFKRLVQFGIPMNLVNASKEVLMEYLKKTDVEREEQVKVTIERINEAFAQGNEEDDDDEDDEPSSVKNSVAKNDTVATDFDFDLTQLTEEQRNQLNLSVKMGKG